MLFLGVLVLGAVPPGRAPGTEAGVRIKSRTSEIHTEKNKKKIYSNNFLSSGF